MNNYKKDKINDSIINDNDFKVISDKFNSVMSPLLDIILKQQEQTMISLKPMIDSLTYNQMQFSSNMESLIEPLNIFIEKTKVIMEPFYNELPKTLEKFSNLQKKLEFLNILSKNYWPIHLCDEDDFQELVLANKDNVDESIISYFSIEKLSIIRDFIVKNDSSREEIYKEAFDNYYSGRFYSCVSLLMCQIDKVMINKVVKSKYYKLINNPEININSMVEEINQVHNVNYNVDKKHNRLKLLLATYEDVFLPRTNFLTLVVEIYKSTDNNEKWLNLPYRNKICHGEQLNFGTRSHALKTILLVYGLSQINAEYGKFK